MSESESVKSNYCSDCVLVNAECIDKQTQSKTDLLVVSNYPFINGYAPKTFVGEFGEKANRMVKNVVLEAMRNKPGIVDYTYAIRCVTDSVNFKPDASVYNKCSYLLKSHIDKTQPRVIVTLGLQAFKGLEFRLAKLADVRGRIFKFEGATVIPTFHPMEIIKTPGKMELFKKDIALAVSIVNGDEDVSSIITYCPTEEADILDQLWGIKEFIDTKAKETGRPYLVSVDTETTGLKPYGPNERVIMISLSWDNNKGIAFPYYHRDFKTYSNTFYAAIQDFFNNSNMVTVYHNAKFDVQWLNNKYGINCDNIYWDTLLAEHLVDEDKKGNYSLKDLTCLYYPSMGKYEDELKHVLAESRALAITEYKEARVAILETQVKEWVQCPIRSQAADWVDKGYITMDDASLLTGYPVSKRTNKPTKATMAKLAKVFLKIPELPLPTLRKVTFEDIEINTLLKYAAIDAIMTRKLVGPQSQACIQDSLKTRQYNIKPLTWALHNISIPLTKLLADVEYNGIKVDRNKIAEFKQQLKEKIAESEEALYMSVGHKFNYKAAELNKILFDELKLPVLKTTKTGKPSTDADTLSELYKQTNNTVVKALLSVRRYEKVYTTYLTAWEKLSADDGKLHTQFNQTNVATHRLSSSNPEHRLGL